MPGIYNNPGDRWDSLKEITVSLPTHILTDLRRIGRMLSWKLPAAGVPLWNRLSLRHWWTSHASVVYKSWMKIWLESQHDWRYSKFIRISSNEYISCSNQVRTLCVASICFISSSLLTEIHEKQPFYVVVSQIENKICGLLDANKPCRQEQLMYQSYSYTDIVIPTASGDSALSD